MKKRIALLALALLMIVAAFPTTAFAAEAEGIDTDYYSSAMYQILAAKHGQYSDNQYGKFQLSWDSSGWRDVLKEVQNEDLFASYQYDDEGWRVSKTVNGITTTYIYGILYSTKVLISENRDGTVIEYFYNSNRHSIKPTSFSINGQMYQLLYDDAQDHVIGIADTSGDQITQYTYKNGLVASILEKDPVGNWVDVTNSPSSVGAINRIRYFGYYFDEETSWYYCHRYFDSREDRFIDGGNYITSKDIPEIANIHFAEENSVNGTMSIRTEIETLFNDCLTDAQFGKSISNTPDWFSSLMTVEIAARIIYAENTYPTQLNDRRAIGWVIFNRIYSQNILGHGSLRGVCTYPGQFASLNSYNARTPDTSSQAWAQAVYIACVLDVATSYPSSSATTMGTYVPAPSGISSQLFFRSLTSFKPSYTQTPYGLVFEGNNITDVTIVDISSNITNGWIIDNVSNPEMYNIFYNIA